LCGKPDSLGFTSGQCSCRSRKGEVVKPHIHQKSQSCIYFLQYLAAISCCLSVKFKFAKNSFASPMDKQQTSYIFLPPIVTARLSFFNLAPCRQDRYIAHKVFIVLLHYFRSCLFVSSLHTVYNSRKLAMNVPFSFPFHILF